ncbi:two-component system sensor histidine kinase CreC [Collimonas sp. H4R21]|uniref:histidine kinase n=1 Tax=Collimonas rhizosphaerae TaxID=3126357 RepID=A0ABU9PVD1_9BURK|nr:two-component system sensor histidine kinase CreC [Collimonas sp. OK412]SFC22845.1 two-component system, OmpR family, sensor histidine kinase CreC [Collimonas sp. OK412]
MKLGIRILLGYFLIVGLAGVFIQRVFLAEVKPAVRQAMEDTLVDTANILAELAADDMKQNRIADGNFASRVREYAHRDINAKIWSFRKTTLDYRIYVTDLKGIVQFDSTGRAIGQDYSRRNDVYLTLRGNYGVRSTRDVDNDDSSTVMHVAAPIIDQGKMIGVLTVAKPNNTLQPAISQSERTILRWGALLLVLSLAVGLAVTLWISRSLGALQRYARAVTAGERAQPPARGASEIVELGRALESMRQRLEGKQYVEHYIHSLTHEMKSPLAAIRGAAELLDEDLPAAEQRRFAHNIRGQSQRLSELIEKMLALAAIEHRQALENIVAVNLGQLLADVIALLEPRLQQAKVTVQVANTAGLPQIRGELFLLRQALLNLLENAIDFSPPGSVITVQADTGVAGVVTLAVMDSGPGIPDYALERVFERFYSLPRPASNEKSTGLGLCFVQQVAQLHHGQITLRNRSTGGAEARLTLPFQAA